MAVLNMKFSFVGMFNAFNKADVLMQSYKKGLFHLYQLDVCKDSYSGQILSSKQGECTYFVDTLLLT